MYHSANPSALNFPPEIVAAIFVEYVEGSRRDLADYHLRINPRLAPLTLASVSRPWRQLVHSTSQLWSTCWLSYCRPELNSVWLSRAGNSKIILDGSWVPRQACSESDDSRTKVIFSDFDWTLPSTTYPLHPFLTSIKPYFRQCVSFSIRYRLLRVTSAAKHVRYDFDAPNLNSVRVLEPYSMQSPLWLRQLLRSAPRLECLHLIGSLNGISLGKGPSTLKDATLTGMAQWAEHLLPFLESSRVLQKLTLLDDGRFAPNWESLNGHLNHASLVHLDLRFDFFVLLPALDQLTLPSLKILSLDVLPSDDYSGDGTYTETLCAFLERSKCTLRDLCLNMDLDPADDTYSPSILKHPMVSSSLEIYRSDLLTNELVDFLSNVSNVPRLRELHFTGEAATIYEWNLMSSVVKMILARRAVCEQQCSKLEYFELSAVSTDYDPGDQDEPDSDCVAQILALVKATQDDATPFKANIDLEPGSPARCRRPDIY